MKKIIFAAVAIAAMVGCSKTESVEIDDWSGELRITSGIETRASGTTWAKDDKIGVFMSNTGGTTAVGLHNSKYTTSSEISTADFTADTDVTPLYYPQSGDVDIVAHYPYNSSATVDSYPICVADQSKLEEIDFMSTKVVEAVKSSSSLSLTFYHLLSQVKVVLEAGDGLTDTELESATVEISGTKVEATAELDYDTTASKPTANYNIDSETVAQKISTTAADGTATFIVVPQMATVTFTISVDQVGDLVTPSQLLTFVSGNEHTYEIKVSRTAAIIKGATIEGWGGSETSDGSFVAKFEESSAD
ncbi:MAG: fimbrillin family protein [Rikenellaceae bacterium]